MPRPGGARARGRSRRRLPEGSRIIVSFPENTRIVCVDPLPPKIEALFLQSLTEGQLACPRGGDAEETTRLAHGAKVLLTRGGRVDAALIESALPGLELIHVLGRTPDAVDLVAAEKAGVAVATMPHGGAMAVADHAMALMLAVARRIVSGHLGVARGDYRSTDSRPERTSEWSFAFNWLGLSDVVEINRKTLGLIGLGEIGKEVARRARGFDMEVLYHRRRRLDPEWEARLGVRSVSLETLLRQSDVVSLHAPHTAETEKMLDEARLRLLKPSAILVNTSRGGLVDETALASALEEGRFLGAGLDVFEEEPLPETSPLCRLPNVVLAPHTGGGSGGGQRLLIRQVLENAARFLNEGTLENRVSTERLDSR